MADGVVVNTSTGEERRRPLTSEEQAQHDADQAAAAAAAQAEQEATAKRAADEQAWRDGVRNATSLAALKDAILGVNVPVQPDVRPKNLP